MTFLMNEEDFPVFFSENEEVVDFQYATQPFLSRCFGVPKVGFVFFVNDDNNHPHHYPHQLKSYYYYYGEIVKIMTLLLVGNNNTLSNTTD
jgi:hypothetical protein